VGAFDGVHRGHRELLAGAESPVAVFTREPNPGDELLCSLARRVELLAAAGAATVTVVATEPRVADAGGVAIVRDPDEAEPATQTAIRAALSDGDVGEAAELLGRPPEVEGVVVGGDARGRALGFPTANLDVDDRLVVPALGIYAGWAAGTRAAISIGTNPTYGGLDRRIEAFLLDFEGDLYGQRLVLELWARLRDEIEFANEQELVEQIAVDVAATRRARRPA
jgi:riboflavin kinase / FMN adenylyltransferase